MNRRLLWWPLAVLAATFGLVGCGGGGDDLTLEEQLGKLAGRPLTPAEVDEQLALADTMCGFDSRVLTQIWNRLDARQLEFQDFVFGQHCPDRLSLYEEARLEAGAVPPTSATTETTGDDEAPTPGELLESITSDSDGDANNSDSDANNSDTNSGDGGTDPTGTTRPSGTTATTRSSSTTVATSASSSSTRG